MTAPARYRVRPTEYDVRPYPDMPPDAPDMDEEIESLRHWCGGRTEWIDSSPCIVVAGRVAHPGDYILRSPKTHSFSVVGRAGFDTTFERIVGYR